ncbi:MAG TPA: hypothetical protein VM532_10640, partial [Burkholderiales bacterium]|nr:hypothetical protein [Burkholderiales bacterium]
MSTCNVLVTHMPPGRKQAPNLATLLDAERGNPVSLLPGGQQAARPAHGGAGLGGRKKRRLRCNGVDTGFNVIRRESEPTSGWSYLAR